MSVPIGGEWLPSSREYVKGLENRIEDLEKRIAVLEKKGRPPQPGELTGEKEGPIQIGPSGRPK